MTLSANFWIRDPEDVARDLIGKAIFSYHGLGEIDPLGVVMEVDAYNDPLTDRNREVFSYKPGTLGMFGSRRGAIATIAAHKKSDTGLVTLRKLVLNDRSYGPKDIAEMVNARENQNNMVESEDTNLYFGETGINYNSLGLQVVNKMPSDGPENRVAYFKFERK